MRLPADPDPQHWSRRYLLDFPRGSSGAYSTRHKRVTWWWACRRWECWVAGRGGRGRRCTSPPPASQPWSCSGAPSCRYTTISLFIFKKNTTYWKHPKSWRELLNNGKTLCYGFTLDVIWNPMSRIRDILARIRNWLTNLDPDHAFFESTVTIKTSQLILRVFIYGYFLKVHLHNSTKIRSHKEVTKQ